MSRHKGRDPHDEERLLADYVDFAVLYGQALGEGDHKKANRYHSRVTKVYQELSALGSEAEGRLLELLEHPEVAVRCWAAAHALNFAPSRGEPVLAEIAARGPLPLCMTAETVLEAWRTGTLLGR